MVNLPWPRALDVVQFAGAYGVIRTFITKQPSQFVTGM